MIKKRFVYYILILVTLFSTLFSFSISFADGASLDFDDKEKVEIQLYETNNISDEQLKESLKKLQTKNALELELTEIVLSAGDFILDYIVFLYEDEITLDRLIFNKVMALNPNFFEYENKSIVPTTTEFVCKMINKWYSFFRGIAIVIYLIVIIIVGIKIMLGTASQKVSAYDSIYKWTLGIALIALFPYVMKYAFKLNDAIVAEVRKSFTNNNPYEEIIGSYVGGISDVQYDQVFEERSPEYISRSDYVYNLGTPEATLSYIKQVEKYQERGDVMRVMRAIAGVTGKLIYAILWIIMLGQMIILLLVYTKRFLIIAFLIIIYPLAVIEQMIGTLKTGKGGAFSAWCMEFFLNVFTQTIHAIIYGIIGGVVMAHVQNALVNGKGLSAVSGQIGYLGIIKINSINWIILITSVNFIFEGEKILKKIIKANSVSIGTGSDMFGVVRKTGRGVRGAGRNMLHLIRPPKH